MTQRAPLASRDSIFDRRTRLFDRGNTRSWTDDLGRLAAGLLVVGSIFASLYLLAS